MRLLIAKGADPNVARENGETPLMAAARLGQVEVMKMLLDRGANVNARDKKFDQTALMWAAGHPDAVRILVDHGADMRMPLPKPGTITATIYTPTTGHARENRIPVEQRR